MDRSLMRVGKDFGLIVESPFPTPSVIGKNTLDVLVRDISGSQGIFD